MIRSSSVLIGSRIPWEAFYDTLHEQTGTFRDHLDQLSSKRTPAYTDWWNDQFLNAIIDDAKQFFTPDTEQLATALTEPDAAVSDTVTVRARVNQTLLEIG